MTVRLLKGMYVWTFYIFSYELKIRSNMLDILNCF